MNIEKMNEAIMNCRFCFMCRHLSAIGNVSFSDADTPRVRAALAYATLTKPEIFKNPDYAENVYRSDLSACCRFHCVNHFDENGLNLAVRQDLVEAGLAPAAVAKLAKALQQKAGKCTISGKGDVLFFEDEYTTAAKTVAPAFAKVMKAAKINYRTITGGCIGKALAVLGYIPEAKAAAAKFAKMVNDSKAKTIVVTNPAAYDALVNDFKAWKIKLNAKVQHSSEFIAGLKLKFKAAGSVYFLESDYLKNYNNRYAGPAALLKALKAKLMPFGTNDEESYTCGEGAVVLPKLHPELVEKLAKYVAERADDPKKDLIVVASPYSKIYLAKYGKLNVKTLDELAADCL